MLQFIGTGSAFAPNLGNTSAYFLKDDNLYLIDCGSLVFKELYNQIDFDLIKNVYIFITHTHNDHVGSLGTLLSYLQITYELTADIFHGGIQIEKYLASMGVSADYYESAQIESMELDGICFDFIETEHSDRIDSYGILIKKEGKILFYSGDSASIPIEILDPFLEQKIDYLYQDITLEARNSSHMSLDELEELIPAKLRNRVIGMHLDEGTEEIISERGFQVAKVAKE